MIVPLQKRVSLGSSARLVTDTRRCLFLSPRGITLALAVAALTLTHGLGMAAEKSSLAGHGPTGSLPLADSERVYIADIEHHGLILSRKGFPALAAAIRRGEAAAVKSFLGPSFRGETLDVSQGVSPQTQGVEIRRALTEGDPKPATTAVDADGFVEFLLRLRQPLQEDAKVELALMSLSPEQREKINGAWKGSAALRLAGARVQGGPAELLLKLEFGLARVPDVDLIATEAGWVQSLRVVEIQQAGAPNLLMAEVGKSWGIDRTLFQDNWTMPTNNRPPVTGGIYVADVDDDGRDDILVTDRNGVFLFQAQGDRRFKEITESAGLPRNLKTVVNAAFGDFDGDGLVDLLLDSRAFRNIGGAHFEEVTAKTGFRFGSALGLVVGDYDKDGRLDLYVPRYHGGKMSRYGNNSWIDGPGGPGNQLWRNLGGWKFEEVSEMAHAQAGRRSCFSAAWLDANSDGWPDIYVINEFGGGVLLVNQGNGKFTEQPLLSDAGDFGSMGMAVGDYDNDGQIDVYTANMYSKAGRRIMENLTPGTYPPEIFAKIKRFITGSELYHNRGGLKFDRVGKAMRVHAVGWAYGATFVDLDNDGFLDLYGTAGFASVNKEEPDG
jgi:hypothetical protein